MGLKLIFPLTLILCFAVSCSSNHSNPAPVAPLGTTDTGPIAFPVDSNKPTPGIRVVIDRAPHVEGGTGQRLQVYEKGVLKYTFVISTGRETFDIPPLYNIAPYCSTTPKGTFRPTKLEEMYYSNTWATAEVVKDAAGNPVIDPDTLKPKEIIHKAEMPHAIFFINGVAIHGTEHIEHLGEPASGACVRVLPKEAASLFELVAAISFENTEINVVDSRPQKDQDAIAAKCAEDRAWFKDAEQECFDVQKAIVSSTAPDQNRPKNFLARLFSRTTWDPSFSNTRNLTDDETIEVKKFCRAKLRADIKVRRQMQAKGMPMPRLRP